MEGLGAAAAAEQLVRDAFKLVQLIRSIRDKYQGAPKELEAWRQEVEDLLGLIKNIEALPTLDGYEIDATIESCRTICRGLIDIFSGLDFTASDSRLHKTWLAIKGIDQEPVVIKHFEELQRFKGTLLIKINISQFTQGYQTAQDVQFIKAAIQPGTEEERCLKSLFITNPTDHRDAIITAKGVRVEGTCEWITSTDEYKAWIMSPPSLLWLSGGPGKGKTFISIFLTKRLSESAHVIYFFCDNKDASRNTAVAIIRGLLYQLIDKYPRLLHHVFTPWKIQQDALFNSNSFESLWRIFQTMLEDLDLGTDLICVLDGLDECADDSLPNLLQKIKILFTESVDKHRLSLIILSRRHPKCLERMLGSFPRIDLDSDQVSNQPDINSYITSRVAQLAERKGISTSLVKHIEETFREKSQDTFLWVSFMADDLEKQTVPGIEKALQTLPKGLDEIYKRILLSIKPDNIAIIATMLKWISLAMFPLTVPQLAEAMRINASGYLSKEELCESYIESCGHLLQLSRLSDADEEESQDASSSISIRVTFVHQSVKDFLFGLARHHAISAFHVNKAQGDLDIACQLLSSMQNEWLKCVEDQRPWQGYKDINGYPLARYAQSNWDLHLKRLQDKGLWQLIDRNPLFFSDMSAIRDKWRNASSKELSSTEAINLLQFSCEFGLVALATKLLKRRKLTSPFTFQRYVNRLAGHSDYGLSGRSPLCLAIDSGNTELIQLLLSYKANIESRCTSWNSESALQYATKRGDLEIFQILAGTKIGQRIIDEDIKSIKKGVKRDSLLHLAAGSGNGRMCSYLLKRYNYDIEAEGAGGQTPICDAIRGNSVALARIFVNQWGASTAAADKILKAAAKSRKYFAVQGSGEELEFVISELKIDINARDECGQTILHYAFERMPQLWYSSETCYAFAVRCLVLGADPSLRSTTGQAPFHLYRWFGHPRIAPFRPVVLLLRDGRLGVNEQDNRGMTLLHSLVNDAFGRYGDFKRNDLFNGLSWLLDVGADRTLVSSYGMTALQLAKNICDDSTDVERGPIIEAYEDIADVLENYATVSNQPQRLDPLDWSIEILEEDDV